MFVLQHINTGHFFRFASHGSDTKDVFFADRFVKFDNLYLHAINELRNFHMENEYVPMEVTVKLDLIEVDLSEIEKQIKRENALAKLSTEDREILGLT